jgi:hypothetical protein
MKALTIWQPWASLIFAGAKPFEFRPYDYRTRDTHLQGQRIVICAGGRFVRPSEVMDIMAQLLKGDGSLIKDKAQPIIDRLLEARKCQGVLPLGCGLGTVTIGAPRKLDRLFKPPDSDKMRSGMWAWPMLDPIPFVEPVPMRGQQGFFNWYGKVELAA